MVIRLQLPGHQAGSVVLLDLVALANIHPAKDYRRPAGSLPSLLVWDLRPDALLVEELQFNASRLLH